MANNRKVKPELTLRQILSVRCPMCRALPKEKCTLTTGHPCVKTHRARALAAAKAPRAENSGQAALRNLRAFANRSFRDLFHKK